MGKIFGADLADALQGVETSIAQAHSGGEPTAAVFAEGFGAGSITRDMGNDIAAPRPTNGFDLA